DIASSSVNVNGAAVTSSGKIGGLNFAQVAGGSFFLGPAAAAPGNISPAVVGATGAQGTPTAGVFITPTTITLNASSLVATYSPAFGGVGAMGSLWGYTSDLAPAFNFGSIQDSGLAANGTVPSNITVTGIPEPSTMALAGLGALGLIGYGLRRRKA